MQELMLFENIQVEVIEIHSIVYFNPYHVARCLGLGDSAVRMAISKMTKNQATTLKNSDVKDIDIRKLNNRGETFLTESGVYKLAFKSNKPNAEAFTNWIADEVLPTIRRTGKYELPAIKRNPLLESSIYHATELSKINSELITEHDLEIGHLKDRIHFLEEEVKAKPAQPKQPKPKTKTTTKKTPVYRFTDVKSIYDDINNNYQSLFTSKELNKKGSSPAVISKMVFRWFELSDIKLKGNKLHLQTNKYNNASNMDIYNITKAEKTIGDHSIATYKIYYEGGTEPIIFQAVLKGRTIEI